MKVINCHDLKQMLINGSNSIANEFRYINELNVFPVPDGDTGTNLKITISNAISEINDFDVLDISLLGRAFSRALLMNARGNSGVIFSQIIKGFTSSFKKGQEELTIPQLIDSFKAAKEISYNAVSNPVEGTILTVIRMASEKLSAHEGEFTDVTALFDFVVQEAKIALDNTPNQLEELRRAGVVDSGGYGLWTFLVGMQQALIGKTIEIKEQSTTNPTKKIVLEFDEHDNEGGFGYCSEIIMKIGARICLEEKEKKAFNFERFKASLAKLGNSIVCVQDEDIVKVHIHTFNPGQFLNLAQNYGEFIKLKFENMTEQYYDRIEKEGIKIIDTKKPNPHPIPLSDEQAIVMTCPSTQIQNILKKDYGINHTLNTEHIGNPSIKDILKLIQSAQSNKVVVLTDDSNIVLAANQAAEMVKESITVKVVKGVNIIEALIAALEFNRNVSLETNERVMKNAISSTKSAVISQSIKDIRYSNIEVKKDDYISIINKKVKFAHVHRLDLLKQTVDFLMRKAKNLNILLVIYQSSSDLKILKELENYVEEKYELICDFKKGSQKVYNYFIGLQ